MDDTTRQIVDFVTNLSFSDLDAKAVDAGALRVLDTVGCGLGALDAGPAQAARRASYPVAAGGARIWGSGERVSVEDAAFTNGIALRYLDFNDAYRGKVDVGHPSDNLGGLLALADARGLSGRALLEGMAVAYELQCRMSESVPLNDLGWDQPTAVVIASAAGAAKMLGLDAEGTANALAIAIIPHMAMHQARVPELTWWKGCAAAMGSRQGVYAARLAEQGMEGPLRAFDGKDGFWDQLGQQYGIPELGGGDVWGIQMTNIKTWPVRDSCQLVIDTALELRERGVVAEEVESIRMYTYRSNYRWAVADPELWKPQTRETADHSAPFCCAVALIDGGVGVETFSRGRFLDADVLGLLDRMQVEVDDEFTRRTPGIKTCRIDIVDTAGRTTSVERTLSQEDIQAGLPEGVIFDKVRSLCDAAGIAAGATESIISCTMDIAGTDDVARLVDLYVGQSS